MPCSSSYTLCVRMLSVSGKISVYCNILLICTIVVHFFVTLAPLKNRVFSPNVSTEDLVKATNERITLNASVCVHGLMRKLLCFQQESHEMCLLLCHVSCRFWNMAPSSSEHKTIGWVIVVSLPTGFLSTAQHGWRTRSHGSFAKLIQNTAQNGHAWIRL